MPWYQFTPIGSLPFNPGDPNNYTLVGSTPPICPNPNNFLCAIQTSGGGTPIITCALLAEIALALVNRLETTNVLLRPVLV